MGDFTYRTREEVAAWKARCPIERLRRSLLERGLAGESELADVEARVKEAVDDAQRFAEGSAWPDPASATSHVFADAGEPARRDRATAGAAPEITFMQATLEALAEEMEKNPAIFVLGEGIGQRGGNFRTTAGLFERFGAERLRDTPISERGFVGLSAGAAMTGTRPVVDFMFVDFLLDGVGEVVNQIAKIQYMSSGRLRMPVLLRGCVGIGNSAATHHSGSYYSLFANVPGLRVVVPSNPHDAKGLLKHALRSPDPVLFLEHRGLLGLKGPVPEGEYEVEFGRAWVAREGSDVTVVAMALMVQHALKASAELEKEGVRVEVIDPRTVAPLDVETVLRSVRKTGRLLIVDEAFGPCGVGAEIAAQLADRGFDQLDAPVRRLNGAMAPTPYSPPLEAAVVPDPATIAQAIRDLLAE
jgi:2-oxoisovalerate dehydrogenase E1 component